MEFQRFEREDYALLPQSPGVYKFHDASGIIYVGKAKNLKKRVSSYFTKSNDLNRKTYKLVSEIHFIEVTLVNTEFDALLLENSLIKENQPKYNILLKDDKSFPSICVTNDRFPKIYSTRRIDKSKGQYFGPYTSVKAMNNVLDLIRKLYSVRTCNLNLSERNIKSKKFKVCLEYHLGNCLGPCEDLQTEEAYKAEIAQAVEILKGKLSIVRTTFQKQMTDAAAELNFELAQLVKEKLEYLEKFQAKSLIVPPNISDVDVFTIVAEANRAFINYMMIEHGAIKISETVEVRNELKEDTHHLLEHTMLTLRSKYNSSNSEILSNLALENWPDATIVVPKIGDKRKLVELSLKNALLGKKEKLEKTRERTSATPKALTELQDKLRLTVPPLHIECFDNSNIQGTSPVSSMVCFKNGKPSKKDYRKFHVKTVQGPDDFSSMKEVVSRRYRHLKNENLPFPDLIVIDGGKGQLKSALEALDSLDIHTISIVGIAKRLEEIYVPNDPYPILFHKQSQALRLLQQLRDEAHRFAITFHRDTRSKKSTASVLDEVAGIGKSKKDALLNAFGSIEAIRNASIDELSKIIGEKPAENLLKVFDSK